VPHLRAMGARVGLTLDRHGFASGGPHRGNRGERDDRAAHRTRDDRGERDERAARDDRRGERERSPRTTDSSPSTDAGASELGQLTLIVEAGGALRPIEIVDAGPIVSRHAAAILARLPTHVAEREHGVVREQLGWSAAECEVREVRAAAPANVLLLEVERAEGRELVTSLGEKGLRAETVAQRACDDMAAFLAAGVPVGEHLADQLLLPIAVAGGGRFRTRPLSLHATTNIATIQAFLDVAIEVGPGDGDVTVTVGSRDHL
ncbi:MAG TPA: RNA 3'-terminal phosphate cyclase, partial [Kofleriaceae bacterium]